jgi:RimJ/RimL family protein N-acetyltransferase
MTLHAGAAYRRHDVAIGPVDVDAVQAVPVAADVLTAREWLAEALVRTEVYYFTIAWHGTVVGQILLHDINRYNAAFWNTAPPGAVPPPLAAETQDALVAYHIFDSAHRGKGIGTTALTLLQRYVLDATMLRTLIINTSRDNPASQRVAQKCGFVLVAEGPNRNDPQDYLSYMWTVPPARSSSAACCEPAQRRA